MVMTHKHTKTQIQRSVGSKDRVRTNGQTVGRTDGRTDATNCINFPANAVGNQDGCQQSRRVKFNEVKDESCRTRRQVKSTVVLSVAADE